MIEASPRDVFSCCHLDVKNLLTKAVFRETHFRLSHKEIALEAQEVNFVYI